MHVLLALEKTKDLLQWGLGGPTPLINTPSGITVDPCYSPIPVGDLDGSFNGSAPFSMEESATFVVRALVDEEHVEVAHKCLGGDRVFSDPLISLYPTCFGDPAVEP